MLLLLGKFTVGNAAQMQALPPESPLAPLPVSFPTIPFAGIAAAAPSPALQNMPAQLRPACRLERAPLYWKIYERGDKREEGEGGREGPGAVMGVIRKPDPPARLQRQRDLSAARIDQPRNIARPHSI